MIRSGRILAVVMWMIAGPSPAAVIRLCPGLTVVTAIGNPAGDYESIKTILSVSADRHRIKYSAEGPNNDMFDRAPIFKLVVNRTVLTKDLLSATMYEQVFTDTADEVIPGTTSIGFSAAVLKSLKTKGAAQTDGIGGDQSNLALSQRRSAAVKAALVKRYGIDANRLATGGFGKSQPKDTNDTMEGRARNRRVELVRM